jgi:hypothetical protein
MFNERLATAMLSSYSLTNCGERHGLLDKIVIVGQCSRRERDEGLEDLDPVWKLAMYGGSTPDVTDP